MKLIKTEIECDEYFIYDECQYRRSQETVIIDGKLTTKYKWLFKVKPNELIEGSSWAHWDYCSEMESIGLESLYENLDN